MYAALDSLRGYLRDVGELFQAESDSIRRYFGVWKRFCTHAFSQAQLFDLLFFSEYSLELYKVIQDYYRLFPEELSAIDADLQRIFLQGDFDYRDYLMLHEIVKQGCMEEADAVVLNNVAVNLFKGYFKTVLDLDMQGDMLPFYIQKFLDTLWFVLKGYITAGWPVEDRKEAADGSADLMRKAVRWDKG